MKKLSSILLMTLLASPVYAAVDCSPQIEAARAKQAQVFELTVNFARATKGHLPRDVPNQTRGELNYSTYLKMQIASADGEYAQLERALADCFKGE